MKGKSVEGDEALLEDGSVLTLHADMIDAGNEYIVCAELPGVTKEKVEVNLTSAGIQICGECECERKYDEMGASFIKRELLHTRACRYLSFPNVVDPEIAVARLDKGLLEVKVTKAMAPGRVPSRPRRVPVELPMNEGVQVSFQMMMRPQYIKTENNISHGGEDIYKGEGAGQK